jgi:hypothetical protein
MSAGFTDSDLDRLADFTAGVLGPDEEAEVARLVATVPAWAAAYDALVGASERAAADLRAESQTRPEPMPADIAARIDAALLGARTHDSGTPHAGAYDTRTSGSHTRDPGLPSTGARHGLLRPPARPASRPLVAVSAAPGLPTAGQRPVRVVGACSPRWRRPPRWSSWVPG